MIELQFEDFDTWDRRCVRRKRDLFRPQPFTFPGGTIQLSASVSEHHDLRVLGHEWIPVQADGMANFDRMVHSPGQYLAKTRALQPLADGHWRALATRSISHERLVLLGGAPHYYHWMVDAVPRLLLARSCGYRDWQVLINDQPARFQLETLAMLGVTESQIVTAGLSDLVTAGSAAVSPLLAWTTLCHPVVPRLLRQAMVPSRVSARRRLFLGRAEGQRGVVNEDELMAVLAPLGFERIVTDTMTVQEQVDAFSTAEYVVAPHAPALANLMFCPPQARVIEIASRIHRATFMYVLASVCKLRHRFVDAEVITQDDPSPLDNDWYVEPDLLRQALAALDQPDVAPRPVFKAPRTPSA